MKNWKTTLFGIVTALGATLSQSDDLTLQAIGNILLPIGTLLTGYFAQDTQK